MKLLMQYLTLILIFCVILVSGTSASASSVDRVESALHFEGSGYDTPEEAAASYIDAARRLDVEGMVRAFAIEHVADRCDTLGWISKSGYWDVNIQANLIADDSFIDYYRALSRLKFVTNTIMFEFIHLNNPDYKIKANIAVNVEEEGNAAIDNVKTVIDVSRLAEMLPAIDRVAFYDADEIESLLSNSRRYQNQKDQEYKKQYAQNNELSFGADEYSTVIGEFSIGESAYYFSVTAGSYDGRWYLLTGNNWEGMALGKDFPSVLFFRKPIAE